MTISAISSSASSAANQAQKTLAGNFDTFLKLLTTQLQNQDPTSPMDSNEFTQQLVQFADVEQSIATNKNLEKLVNLSLANSMSSAASYLGKSVTAGGDTASLSGGSARWNYTLGANAASTALTVKDASGKVVYETLGDTSAGPHTFTWDGRTSAGGTAPDGTYTISIAASDAGGNTITSTTQIAGDVTAVDVVDNEVMLKVNDIDVSPSDIISIGSAADTGTGS